MVYGPIEQCQNCGAADLRSVLFLGYLPPVNTMRPLGVRPDREECYPAELLSCPRCHLAQLGYAVDPRILFPPEYPYTSGSTRILRANFADLYQEVRSLVDLSSRDLIVDIGSNDGTLLSNFRDGGHRVLGIEPTRTGELAQAQGIPTHTAFFSRDAVEYTLREHGAPTVVTAANVFAHILDVHQVLDGIEHLVGTTGVFISESHYLRDLVETLQYDTIYHEHLRYYSLASARSLLEAHGLRVFHARRIPTHGGSIRVYASKSHRYVEDRSVSTLLQEERAAGLLSERWIGSFRAQVARSKLELYLLIARLTGAGERIYGVGAPSRASTLINYTGLDESLIHCVVEIAGSQKINKYVPGTSIPVLDEAVLYADQPPYALLLSWHIAGELCQNLKRRGFTGDFIVPLPTPHVVRNDEVRI